MTTLTQEIKQTAMELKKALKTAEDSKSAAMPGSASTIGTPNVELSGAPPKQQTKKQPTSSLPLKRLVSNLKEFDMNLEKLLRMEIKGTSPVSGEDISYPPEYRVAVQNKTDEGVHIIIHANGHNSDTLDFLVRENELIQM